MTDRPLSSDAGPDSWPSSVEHGPFRAEQLDAHGGFWWVVRNVEGDEIDDSADGGFTEKSAKWIAEALNEKWERENHAA